MAKADDLTIRERDGVTIVRFNNESLLGHDVEHLRERILALIEGGVRRLVLDFKHVRYAGSAALGMALSLSKSIQRGGGKLVLSHTEFIEPLLKVTHARALFTITPDSKSAVDVLNTV